MSKFVKTGVCVLAAFLLGCGSGGSDSTSTTDNITTDNTIVSKVVPVTKNSFNFSVKKMVTDKNSTIFTCLADNSAGIFHIENNQSITFLSKYTLGADCNDLDYSNDKLAVITEGTSGKVYLIDVKNRNNPLLLDYISGAHNEEYAGKSLEYNGTNIFYVDPSGNFVTLDATEPTHLTEIDKVFVGVKIAGVTLRPRVFDINKDNNITYVASQKYIVAVDSKKVGNFEIIDKTNISYYLSKLRVINNDYAIGMRSSFNGLVVINVFNPHNIYVRKVIYNPNGSNDYRFYDFTIDGKYLYALAKTALREENSIDIIKYDISDPENIVMVSRKRVEDYPFNRIVVNGNYIYISYKTHIYVIKKSDI